MGDRLPPAGWEKHRAFWPPLLLTSDQQRRACWERDRGICHDCSRDATKLEAVAGPPGYDMRTGASFSCVEFKPIGWDAEHDVPLWMVKHIPLPDCLWYWTVANLKTRCVPCHKKKTKREAGRRAHHNRISNPKPKKKKWKPRPPKIIS